jgi:hypothetical protein
LKTVNLEASNPEEMLEEEKIEPVNETLQEEKTEPAYEVKIEPADDN